MGKPPFPFHVSCGILVPVSVSEQYLPIDEPKEEPLARPAFGKTWWGRRWIETLEKIDRDTNRLPRGRRYANGGYVTDIRIDGGTVHARVQGSRPRPYSVKISLKRFSVSRLQEIPGLVAGRPDIGADLLLGKLPEKLVTLLESRGLSLFPSSWKEMDSECSCPDWADPCKHRAAVCYILANEIDLDPFLLFELRGVEKKLLEPAPLRSSTDDKAEPFVPWTESKSWLPPALPDLPDLSLETFGIDELLSLLPEKPLFFTGGDFRELLRLSYHNVDRAVTSLDMDENPPDLTSFSFTLLLLPDGEDIFVVPCGLFAAGQAKPVTKLLPSPDGKGDPRKVRGLEVPVEEFWDLLFSRPLRKKEVLSATPSAAFFLLASKVAMALVRAASYVPEVFSGPGGEMKVRYMPLVHGPRGEEAFGTLVRMLPPHLIVREKNRTALYGDEGVRQVLSLLVTRLVCRFSGVNQSGKLCDAFFRGAAYTASRFEEKQTAGAVGHWLEGLSIRTRRLSPVLRISVLKEAFFLRMGVEDRADPLKPPVPLARFLKGADAPSRNTVLRQVAVASDHLPVLREALGRKRGAQVAIDGPALVELLSSGKNVLDLLGIRIVMPRSLSTILRPRAVLKAEISGKGKTASFSLDDLAVFSWEIALGEERIGKEEFLGLLKKAAGVIRFRGKFLMVDADSAREILEKLSAPPPELSPLATLRAACSGEAAGVSFEPGEALTRAISRLDQVDEVPVPQGLMATLRPYQERGYRWMLANTSRGFGVCLADDMGLGKTVQVLAFLLFLKESGKLGNPALVVCPTTLIGNWMKETARFAPGLSVRIHHGSDRVLPKKKEADLVITSYGIVRREAETFAKRDWSVVVLDEAQNIKNPGTDQTRAIRMLKTPARVVLSGTPVENRLEELWSLFEFANPGYLGSREDFRKEFALPVERYADRERMEILRRTIAPFLMRRLKSDKSIAPDLPEKMIADIYCTLTGEQAALYQETVNGVMQQIELAEGGERLGLVLKLITALKQIGNHPSHYLKSASVSSALSGKSSRMIGILEKIIEAGDRCLVFTQYREMGEILRKMIADETGVPPLFFHGGLNRKQRDQLVEDFQDGTGPGIMILSLKAGGTGLNLTRARHVLHYDLWWNPAVESQATDRAYRIGQKQSVMVHRFITLGTFEEKIDEMIRKKKELADRVVSEGEQWISRMSNRELREIFALGAGAGGGPEE